MVYPASHYEYVLLDVVPALPGVHSSSTKVIDPWSSEDNSGDRIYKWCLIYAGFLILLSGVILLIAEFVFHIF